MTPAFRLLADNHDFTALVRDRLISLFAVDHAGEESDRLTVVLDDRDHRLALPRKGALLELHLGTLEGGLALVGRYTVDETTSSGPVATLTIDARAADMRLSLKELRDFSWDAATLAEIAQTIAARNGLEPRWDASGLVSVANIFFEHLDQAGESDLHFLTRLARQNGLVAKPAGPYLVITPRGTGESAFGNALPEIRITPRQCSRWETRFPDRGKYAGAYAEWQDLDAAETVRVHAGDPEGEPLLRVRGTFATAAEALAAAMAAWARVQRSEQHLALAIPGGEPRAIAGGRIRLANTTGTGPRFREEELGLWVATQVSHRLDKETGLTTEIEAEPQSTST